MKRMNQEIPKWILSSKEEGLLSAEDKVAYYAKLREFCANRELCTTTPGALTIAPKLKRLQRKLQNEYQ